MKRVWRFLLVCVCSVCLVLTGCQASGRGDATNDALGGQTQPSTATTVGTQSTQPTAVVTLPDHDLGIQNGKSDLTIGKTGKVRLEYSGVRSSVRYITSPEQIAQYDALGEYDEEFFREHALILVMETVTTGSTDVGISGVRLDGGVAAVTLSHGFSNDAATTVMTTWLLWAEVESGLEYQWVIANPAVASDAQRS